MEGLTNDFVQKLVSRLEKGYEQPRIELPEISEVSFTSALSEALPALGDGALATLNIPDPSEGRPVAEGNFTAALPGQLKPALREQIAELTQKSMSPVEKAPLELQALKGRRDDEAIDEVARQFESQFLYGMLKQIWESLPQTSLLGGDSAGQYYREMWLEELASRISTGPNGIGLAEVVKRDLKSRSEATKLAQGTTLAVLPVEG